MLRNPSYSIGAACFCCVEGRPLRLEDERESYHTREQDGPRSPGFSSKRKEWRQRVKQTRQGKHNPLARF